MRVILVFFVFFKWLLEDFVAGDGWGPWWSVAAVMASIMTECDEERGEREMRGDLEFGMVRQLVLGLIGDGPKEWLAVTGALALAAMI